MEATFNYFDYKKLQDLMEEKGNSISRIYGYFKHTKPLKNKKDLYLIYKDGVYAWDKNRDKDWNKTNLTKVDFVDLENDNFHAIIRILGCPGSWWDTPVFEVQYKDRTSEIIECGIPFKKEFNEDNISVIREMIENKELDDDSTVLLSKFLDELVKRG